MVRAFLGLIWALVTPGLMADAPARPSSLALNLAGLVTNDPSQYPLGLEVGYEQVFGPWSMELLGSLNYAREQGSAAVVAYLEPRLRWNAGVLEASPSLRGFVSAGIFAGFSSYAGHFEPLLGADLNTGLRSFVAERLYLETAVGLQYPDFPTTRTFRLHYWLPEINYLSLRTSLAVGFLL